VSVAWPDIAIGFILLFTTLRGLKRGMVAELTGLVALGFGIAAAFAYTGAFDAFVRAHGHLGAAPAHVIGMLATRGSRTRSSTLSARRSRRSRGCRSSTWPTHCSARRPD
jgi:uncharacterized membrane protein